MTASLRSANATGSARSLLLTLLGEFVAPHRGPVWNATLVRGLGTVGIAEKAARQSIARAAAAGWLSSRREGRNVAWSITPYLRTFIDDGTERVYTVGRDLGPWDGQWLALVINLPEERRAIRQKLYSSLRWAGFGSLTPNLWINPHSSRVDETRRIIQRMELGPAAFSFVGRSVDLGNSDQGMVQLAWDLEKTEQHYAELKRQFVALRPATDEETFLAHIELVTAWQKLPFMDPALPASLRPPVGEGHRIAAELAALLAKWRPIALHHWKQLEDATSPS